MKPKKQPKPKAYDEWIEPVYIGGIGSYQRVGPPNDKTKIAQIGFIRQKKKNGRKG